jgi:trans-aconitate 2-methyltransferase
MNMSRSYEFDGERYKQASTHQKEWGSRIIDGLELKGGESILDLGCGDGVLTKRLADLVPGGRVLGIDASEGMIRSARMLEGGNLRFLVMDIRDLTGKPVLDPEFSTGFDMIFSNATLHWIPDHRQLLSDCRKVLRPDGMIRFSFAGDGNCENFNRIVKETISSGRGSCPSWNPTGNSSSRPDSRMPKSGWRTRTGISKTRMQ